MFNDYHIMIVFSPGAPHWSKIQTKTTWSSQAFDCWPLIKINTSPVECFDISLSSWMGVLAHFHWWLFACQSHCTCKYLRLESRLIKDGISKICIISICPQRRRSATSIPWLMINSIWHCVSMAVKCYVKTSCRPCNTCLLCWLDAT